MQLHDLVCPCMVETGCAAARVKLYEVCAASQEDCGALSAGGAYVADYTDRYCLCS